MIYSAVGMFADPVSDIAYPALRTVKNSGIRLKLTTPWLIQYSRCESETCSAQRFPFTCSQSICAGLHVGVRRLTTTRRCGLPVFESECSSACRVRQSCSGMAPQSGS